jgi:hypothetical protein
MGTAGLCGCASLPAGREQRAHMFVDAAHAEEPDENGLATLHLAGYVRGTSIEGIRTEWHQWLLRRH